MDWLDFGANLVGGYLNQQAAKDKADAAARTASTVAAAAEFKPYAISTGLGTSYFDTDKQQAGYELDPTLRAYRDKFYTLGADFLGGVQTDPTAAARDYYTQQQSLMSGQRGAEDLALRQQQLQSGRIGLGLSGASQGAGMGTGFVNPEQYQRDLARAQADQQMAFDARQRAQSEIDANILRGQGLFTSGAGVEELGMKPLTLGADIGNRVATTGANAASALLGAGSAANNAALQAQQARNSMFTGLFNRG